MKRSDGKLHVEPGLDAPTREALKISHNYEKKMRALLSPLQESLDAGIQQFNAMDFAKAAQHFRKLARDIKLLEGQITTTGKYSERNSLNNLTGKQWLKHTKSWVVMDGQPSQMDHTIKNHPASFPPQLAAYFIEFFTKEQDWVFDPFMGIGSTAEACATLGRNCFGTELNAQYAAYTRRRINLLKSASDEFDEANPWINFSPKNASFYLPTADAKQAAELWKQARLSPVKFLITSPPYWNMLRTTRGGVKSAQKQRIEEGLDAYYSDLPADLGNIDDLDNYLASLAEYFASFKPILAQGAYIMVVLQNCRPKDGIMRPIAWEFAKNLGKIYKLQQEFIWCQDQKFMGIWGYPTTYVSNVHHHYCLVFKKS